MIRIDLMQQFFVGDSWTVKIPGSHQVGDRIPMMGGVPVQDLGIAEVLASDRIEPDTPLFPIGRSCTSMYQSNTTYRLIELTGKFKRQAELEGRPTSTEPKTTEPPKKQKVDHEKRRKR